MTTTRLVPNITKGHSISNCIAYCMSEGRERDGRKKELQAGMESRAELIGSQGFDYPLEEEGIAHGMTRLYRVEPANPGDPSKLPEWIQQSSEFQASQEASGRWFAADWGNVNWYKQHLKNDGIESKVTYLDLKTPEIEQYRVSNLKDEKVKSFPRRPLEEFFLPKALAGRRMDLKTISIEQARRQMEWLAANQASKTRQCDRDCLHTSLSWKPGDRPSNEHMAETSRSALDALGMDKALAIFIRHHDTEHEHCHIVASRINPLTRMTFRDPYDFRKIQQWSKQYELERRVEQEMQALEEEEHKREREFSHTAGWWPRKWLGWARDLDREQEHEQEHEQEQEQQQKQEHAQGQEHEHADGPIWVPSFISRRINRFFSDYERPSGPPLHWTMQQYHGGDRRRGQDWGDRPDLPPYVYHDDFRLSEHDAAARAEAILDAGSRGGEHHHDHGLEMTPDAGHGDDGHDAGPDAGAADAGAGDGGGAAPA